MALVGAPLNVNAPVNVPPANGSLVLMLPVLSAIADVFVTISAANADVVDAKAETALASVKNKLVEPSVILSVFIELSAASSIVTFFNVIVEPSWTNTSVPLICNTSKSLLDLMAAVASASCITVLLPILKATFSLHPILCIYAYYGISW